MIKTLHSILLKETRGKDKHPGNFRKIQNFIGPDNKIEHATYIPIEAQLIDDYMTNLEYFMNGEAHRSLSTNDNQTYLNYDADPLIRNPLPMHNSNQSILF